MVNCTILYKLNSNVWYQFVFLSISFLLIIHAIDRCAMLYFHIEIHPRWWRKMKKPPSQSTMFSTLCHHKISRISQSVPVLALLIDQGFLLNLSYDNCDTISFSITIGVSLEDQDSMNIKDENLKVLYFSNDTKKDYLVFETSESKKIIPKNFHSQKLGNLIVPNQIPLFLEFWRRSSFVECRNISMARDTVKKQKLKFIKDLFETSRSPISVNESVAALAELRDEMLNFGIFPFLNGGTFLGWYRECSVIPHITDMDIAIFYENWDQNFYESLWTHNSSFSVKRQLGMTNDSYELTLVPKRGAKTPIDAFLMYRDYKDGDEYRWVGGLTTSGQKYKYIYPPYDPFCAADLHGHIFWVSCSPENKIKKEYGENWYLDENSSKYTWNEARNAVENGRFTHKQMRNEAYNEYLI